MKYTLSIFLLSFYLTGIFCLPKGDFSAIIDLPGMYRHCKAAEDKDMTPLDFITDHLINIDCLFDKHDNGDEQKPHNPILIHHAQVQNYFSTTYFKICHDYVAIIDKNFPCYNESDYFSTFRTLIFRPPIS